jgi:hypothetical protein
MTNNWTARNERSFRGAIHLRLFPLNARHAAGVRRSSVRSAANGAMSNGRLLAGRR